MAGTVRLLLNTFYLPIHTINYLGPAVCSFRQSGYGYEQNQLSPSSNGAFILSGLTHKQ